MPKVSKWMGMTFSILQFNNLVQYAPSGKIWRRYVAQFARSVFNRFSPSGLFTFFKTSYLIPKKSHHPHIGNGHRGSPGVSNARNRKSLSSTVFEIFEVKVALFDPIFGQTGSDKNMSDNRTCSTRLALALDHRTLELTCKWQSYWHLKTVTRWPLWEKKAIYDQIS